MIKDLQKCQISYLIPGSLSSQKLNSNYYSPLFAKPQDGTKIETEYPTVNSRKKPAFHRVQFLQRSNHYPTRDFIRITDSFGRELTSDQRKYRSDIHYEPTDFAQAKSAIISAKLDNSTMQNLPITIYNTNKQQDTLSRDFTIQKTIR